MEWEISYEVYVDGKPVTYDSITQKGGVATMAIVGNSKKDAYETQFADEWKKIFPGVTPPKRYRVTLVEIDRVRWG